MFIIEGADYLGKTTAAEGMVELSRLIAEHLGRVSRPEVRQERQRAFPIRYQHMSRPNEAFDFLHDYKDLISKFAVQDRFHIGGLVWHEGCITKQSLPIIEGWLQSVGSIVVVMYASDEDWYVDRLNGKGDRPDMFDNGKLVLANEEYTAYVERQKGIQPRIDFAWDCSGGNYPGLEQFRIWTQAWYDRLELIYG